MTQQSPNHHSLPLQARLEALRALAARLPPGGRDEWDRALDAVLGAVSATLAEVKAPSCATDPAKEIPDWLQAIGSDVLQGLLDAMPWCLALLDARLDFAMVNAAYCRESGFSKEELIGRNHFALFPHAENQTIFERARDTGEVATHMAKPFENPRLREKGTTFWDWTLVPVKDDRNVVDLLVLSLTNVTDRIRFQQELKDERDFSSAVLDTAGALVVVLDPQGRVVRFNGACERATGYTFDEVKGRCFWNRLLLPGEAEEVRRVFGSLRAGKFPNEHENFWIAKDGSRRLIAWSNTAILNDGCEVEFIIGTGIDITERRKAERELDAQASKLREQAEILDHAQVLVWDLDGRVLFWNSGAARLYGWSREEAIGHNPHEFLKTEFPLARRDVLAQLLRDGHWQGELRHTCKRGRQIVVASKWVLHRDEQGRPVAVVEVNNDITETKRLEEALQQSRKELAVRNRISEAFLSAPEDEVFSAVLEVVLDALGSKRGFFGYIDGSGNLVCPSMTREVWDKCDIPGKSNIFPRDKWGGLWGRSLTEKKPLYLNNALQVPEGHIVLQRAIAMPIIFSGEVIGQIVLADKETDYTDEDARRLETVCGYIAAILHARRQKDREHEARERAEEALQRLKSHLGADDSFAGIVGRHPRMLELFETIREVSKVDVPVLIQGESGTGKELVAAAIHAQGNRAEGPFLPVNCSALPASLLESELFGHVRGAFSGAIRDKKGRFELADGGTIFLDEIGDIGLPVQVSLLRVLQEGTIERVGGEQIQKVNVRVVSATNKDLRRLIATGKFREDLFYRLCVVPIHVPPLRERRDDIPLLARHFLEQLNRTSVRDPFVLSDETISALMAHAWPGNVRELQNAIYFATVKCKGSVLEPRHLPPGILDAHPSPAPAVRSGRRPKLRPEAVEKILREVGGNKREAARKLGVCRTTLYNYLSRPGE